MLLRLVDELCLPMLGVYFAGQECGITVLSRGGWIHGQVRGPGGQVCLGEGRSSSTTIYTHSSCHGNPHHLVSHLCLLPSAPSTGLYLLFSLVLYQTIPALENIVGKAKNAGKQRFHLSKQFLHPNMKCHSSNNFVCFNQLADNKILDWSKLKAFADDKIFVPEKLKFVLGRAEKHCWKMGKYLLPAFSPFLTMLSKGFLYGSL